MDTWIDPVTRDYVPAGGGLATDPAGGLLNAAYLRLMTARGSYWPSASFGSRLHLLAREKDLARVAVLAKQYAAEALQPLLDDGRAKTIDIVTERQPGRLALAIEIVSAGGDRVTFKYSVKVI